MAGTIFGLPLSQRVDLNGLPSVGWLLYLYQANTSTPVNSYQDTALTVLNPWPIPADAYGMMRQFWLADGSYRARATSANGSLTYFDQLSILALGASAGAAPSGGVDPTAIHQTGDVVWLDRTGVRSGWVIDNGTTIGSALSGASQRSNIDTHPLFDFLWNNFPDSICPVIGGRTSPSGDWGADKKITMPDKRGSSLIGADAMGGTASGRLGTAPVQVGAIDTPGSVVGENEHTLQDYELASHQHTGTTDGQNQDHTHQYSKAGTSGLSATAGGGTPLSTLTTIATGGTSNDHQHTFTTDGAGADAAHNVVQNSIVGTFYRKL